ncbi:MAG: phosphoribosyltransferase [Nitrososphaeraceae archaeon]
MFKKFYGLISSLNDGSFIKIRDRYNAAIILSSLLKDIIKKYPLEKIIIIGIPRGGVIVAETISNRLNISYDIIFIKKLRIPHNEEMSFGAIMENGNIYLDKKIIDSLEISNEYILEEKIRQLNNINIRSKLYQSYIKFDDVKHNIKDKIVIIVDDGAASGATLMVLIKWLKENNVNHIFIGVPVVPKETINLLKKEVKKIETIISPSQNFENVSKYYHDFTQVTDEQVIEILCKKK